MEGFAFSGKTALIFWLSYTAWVITETLYIIRDHKNTHPKDHHSKNVIVWTVAAGIFIAFIAVWRLPQYQVPAIRWMFFASGIIAVWTGIAIRLWAISELGPYFRMAVVVKKKQKVVKSGPYAYVRHPSYTGSLLTLLGIGIALGNTVSLFSCVLLPCIGYTLRIKHEESTLAKSLGTTYKSYMKETKRLIPFIY